MHFTLFTSFALFAMLASGLIASPLDGGRVSHLANRVAVSKDHGPWRQAAQNDLVGGGESLRVERQSRVEILFADRTRARLGGETDVAFRRGTRELTLNRGTLLLEVPAFRGGARVRAGSLTAICGGATILVEHLPSQSLKIVVLEGDVRIVASGFLGDSVVIPPGRMLISSPDAKRIPDLPEVDLGVLVRSCALIDGATFCAGASALTSFPKIQKEISRQTRDFTAKRLIPTNLAFVGSGTSIVIPVTDADGPPTSPSTGGNNVKPEPANKTSPRSSAKIAGRNGTASTEVENLPLPKP